MIAAAVLALALTLQDDVGRLFERLRSDEFADRESAQRALERIGMPILVRLKLELAKETELDTQLRLKSLLERIPKLEQLRHVYGPTRKITFSAKGEKLGIVMGKLGEMLEEFIESEGVDLNSPVTLDLEEATLWESLDRLARASRTHYIYGYSKVVFSPGEAPEQPIVYAGQFRISVAEVKRADYRSPGEKGKAVIVVPEVRYQRNLLPAGNKYKNMFLLDAIEGPTGADAKVEPPSWAAGTWTYERQHALEEHYFVDPSLATVSISGKANVSFSTGSRELSLPVAGDSREEINDDGTFRVAETGAEVGKLTAKLEIEVPEAGGITARFRGGVWVDDTEGKRHLGSILGMNRDGRTFRPELWFPIAPKDAKTIVFRWMTGVHSVELPFTLRNIKIP